MATDDARPQPAAEAAPARDPEQSRDAEQSESAQSDSAPDRIRPEIQVALRNGHYALAVAILAAVAALVSAGVSAWASVHVAGTQLDRQERLAREQAIRADRVRGYSDFVVAFSDLEVQLGGVKAALQRTPPNRAGLDAAVAQVHAGLAPYERSYGSLQIVSSSMDPELDDMLAAQRALWEAPDSLGATLAYAHNHDIVTDADWPRVAAAGAAAIDRFVGDTAIDKFVAHARKDVGSG
ncbi:hypothetical protein KO481_31430 [Nocardia sp. NEAU-G5]|uniref:Uncharacterized protein n=1 Tax=Nocardia albiluteola TaxID=2842303 RepID=A0ABS6B8D9_9NOCA|nr:hypothetical protein [Nocardia albiluteola]MBU3066015.1 hypothetical protein [Nocardia albiluteola]